jgi:hypothetical protein
MTDVTPLRTPLTPVLEQLDALVEIFRAHQEQNVGLLESLNEFRADARDTEQFAKVPDFYQRYFDRLTRIDAQADHALRLIDQALALTREYLEPPPPAGEKAVLLPFNTWSDVETLAQAFCVSAVTLRKRLDAFRAENPKNHGWLEREDPGQRQPVYLYHIATVLSLIRTCPYKGKPAPPGGPVVPMATPLPGQ